MVENKSVLNNDTQPILDLNNDRNTSSIIITLPYHFLTLITTLIHLLTLITTLGRFLTLITTLIHLMTLITTLSRFLTLITTLIHLMTLITTLSRFLTLITTCLKKFDFYEFNMKMNTSIKLRLTEELHLSSQNH
jgi:hypothetical protein